mmetsp:Transcript_42899/g.129967  ORF Transcript_42899/g.129967 Transcript_42899/m.129967 type:complete len:235 (+) Transcript_42899:453-1157(+)
MSTFTLNRWTFALSMMAVSRGANFAMAATTCSSVLPRQCLRRPPRSWPMGCTVCSSGSSSSETTSSTTSSTSASASPMSALHLSLKASKFSALVSFLASGAADFSGLDFSVLVLALAASFLAFFSASLWSLAFFFRSFSALSASSFSSSSRRLRSCSLRSCSWICFCFLACCSRCRLMASSFCFSSRRFSCAWRLRLSSSIFRFCSSSVRFVFGSTSTGGRKVRFPRTSTSSSS